MARVQRRADSLASADFSFYIGRTRAAYARDMPLPMTVPRPGDLEAAFRGRARLRHLSYRTEQTYWDWVRRFIFFHHKQHPREMGAAEVSAFLTHLAVNRAVSASTQSQALNALIFLYRELLDIDLGKLPDRPAVPPGTSPVLRSLFPALKRWAIVETHPQPVIVKQPDKQATSGV